MDVNEKLVKQIAEVDAKRVEAEAKYRNLRKEHLDLINFHNSMCGKLMSVGLDLQIMGKQTIVDNSKLTKELNDEVQIQSMEQSVKSHMDKLDSFEDEAKQVYLTGKNKS